MPVMHSSTQPQTAKCGVELSCAWQIDTCHLIEFNFGAKPFKFDLEGCEEEADLEIGIRSFAEVLHVRLFACFVLFFVCIAV